MKTFRRIVVLTCFGLLQFSGVLAQGVPISIKEQLQKSANTLNDSTFANDYWLAVPLNDSKTQPTSELEFYVLSKMNTVVTLQVPGTGFTISKKIQANTVAIFSTKDATASWDWEVESSEVPDNRGIHIYADNPISVYMRSSKSMSSDGYLAIPTGSLGTDYIHCGYYDFKNAKPWRGGFLVVATEDNTTLDISLKGRGKNFAKTIKGSKIGSVLSVTLDKGQVYNVCGDGTTIGTFDLTGSKVHSSKPTAFISYHERTAIPQNAQGSDFICEMMPPTATWGKKYVGLEFKRQSKGDFFRILGRDNNTTWSMKYYDPSSGQLLGQRNGKLNDGEFYEDYNEWAGAGSIEGFRGVSVWESDKPVLVMQYSYSSSWDNDTKFDASMVLVSPIEQYIRSSELYIPGSSMLVTHSLNYIVVGDPTDTTSAMLKSFVIDGDPVYKTYPQILTNKIPGSNLYWGYRTLTPGVHTVTSSTTFTGTVNGFGNFSGYSWPAGFLLNTQLQNDTVPPVVNRVSTQDTEIEFNATELTNSSDNGQVDQGIFDIYLVDSTSANYSLKYISSSSIKPLPKITEFRYKLSVIDTLKNAVAHVVIMDRAGNFTRDTVTYKAKTSSLDEYSVSSDWELMMTSSSVTARCEYVGLTNATLSLYDVLGREVGTVTSYGTANSLSIPTDTFLPGVYIASLTVNGYSTKTAIFIK